MKKSAFVITVFIILMGMAASSYAGEILGYPIVAKQAKFYSILLGVIGISVGLVAISYLCFWLADLMKRQKAFKPVEKSAYAGKLVAAAQMAK